MSAQQPPPAWRALHGSLSSALGTVYALGSSVAVPYFALRAWSGEQFGLWVAAFGLMGILGAVDYAHQTYVGNRYTMAYFRNDEAAAAILGAAVKWALVLGAGKLAVVTTVTLLLADDGAWRAAYPLLAVHSALSGVLGVLVQAYRPHGEYARSVWLTLGSQLAATVASLLGIWIRAWSPPEAIVAFAIVKGVLETLLIRHTLRRFAITPFGKGAAPLVRGAANLSGAGVLLATAGLDAVVLQGSIVALQQWGGGAEAGLFATARTVGNVVLQSVVILLWPIAHDFVRLTEARDRIGFRAVMGVVFLGFGIILCLAAGALITAGDPVFVAWTKNRFGAPGVVLTALAAAAFFRTAVAPVATFFQQFNRTRVLLGVALVRCLLFVGGMAFAGRHWTAAGTALATAGAEAGAAVALFGWWLRDRAAREAGAGPALGGPVLAAAAVVTGLMFAAPGRWLGAGAAAGCGAAFAVVAWQALEAPVRLRIRAQWQSWGSR